MSLTGYAPSMVKDYLAVLAATAVGVVLFAVLSLTAAALLTIALLAAVLVALERT